MNDGHFFGKPEDLPVAYFAVSVEGHIVDANPAACRLFGVSDGALTGRSIYALCAPGSEGQERTAALVEAHSTDPSAYIETTLFYRRPDGTRFWGRTNSQPVVDESGDKVVAWSTVVLDVHEEEEARRELSERADFVESILETVMSGIVVMGAVRGPNGGIEDFEVLVFNSGAAEITGIKAEDIVGRKMLEAMPGNRESGLFDAYCRVVESDTPIELEQRYDFDGINGWFHITARKLGDGVVVTFTDVTETRRSNESLLEVEERFNSVVRNSALGLLVADQDGGIVFVNESTARMFGYSEEELLALTVEDLVPDESRGHHAALRTGYASDPKNRGMAELSDIEGQRADGSRIPIAIALQAIQWDQGQTQYLATISDMTVRRQLEAEQESLKRAFTEAQKAESLGVLAGGIAHDFNNILAAILGNTELIMMEGEDADRRMDKLREIEKSAVRASELCREMLAYSGRGNFVIEAIDLSRLAEEMTGILEVTVSKRAKLRLDLDHTIPATKADATQIRQVIMNLVINACESIEDGQGEVTVRTGTHKVVDESSDQWKLTPGLHVTLSVSDNGIGFEEKFADKIFDPFFTTKESGSGLGLSAVLGIARSHNGAVWVDSSPGVGSTFTLVLPASESEARMITPLRDPGMAAKGSGSVLVADDDDSVLQLAATILERAGYSVTCAEGGKEALQKSRTNGAFDLVLLDLTMPGMSGLEVMQSIREDRPNTPVVIMSGYTSTDVSPLLADGSLAGFVQKPFTAEALCSALQVALVR